MRIPKTPCPVHGLVPFWNGIYPIVSKKPHPVLLWLYTIHAKAVDQALVIHYNVSQEDIVKEIELFCKFKIGDTVVARVTVKELKTEKRRAVFSTVCSVGSTVVLDGEAELLIPARA